MFLYLIRVRVKCNFFFFCVRHSISFQMPIVVVAKMTGTGPESKCTFALVEGNSWATGLVAYWQQFPHHLSDISPSLIRYFPITYHTGRDWGVAWDFIITRSITPTLSPLSRSLSGVYTLNDDNCANDTPDCKCKVHVRQHHSQTCRRKQPGQSPNRHH